MAKHRIEPSTARCGWKARGKRFVRRRGWDEQAEGTKVWGSR